MNDEKVTYSITEAAAALGISRTTLYNCLLFRSDFPAFKIGERTVIPVKALHEWATKQGQRKEGM